MDSAVRVLIVEDSEDDAFLILRELRHAGYEPIFERVDTASAFRTALTRQSWDAVIADYSMPQFDGLAALKLLRAHEIDLPFIIVSGTIGEDTAVAAMRAGAHDYVLKDNLARLGPAIRRELREAEGRRARRQAEAALRRRTALLEALQQVGLELTAQLDLDTLLHSIVSRSMELLDGTAGGLYLHQPERDVLEWAIGIGPGLPPIGTLLDRGEGLCGKIWETGEPLIVNDYWEWEGRAARFGHLPNVATLGVLVRWGDEFLGVLNVMADLSRPFSRADAEILGLFANQAAIAIRNARLYEAARARSRYLETLQRINATLRSTLPLRDVLDTIAQATAEALGYVGSLIAVPDAVGERLVLGALWGGQFVDAAVRLTGLRVDVFSLPLSAADNPMAQAYLGGELLAWIDNPQRILPGVEPPIEPKLAPLIREAMNAKLAACVPLPGVEGMVGVLVIFSPRGQLGDEERAMLLGLGDQAGLAIENARLYEEARRWAEHLAVVNHVARAVGATLQLDDLLETVYQEVVSIFEADAFFIALYDEESDELDYRLQVDEGIRQAPERHGVGNGLTSVVVSTKSPLLVRELAREQEKLPEPMLWGTMRLPGSWLGVPMRIGERLVGVICVQAYKAHAYGEEDELLLSTIADQIAVAVEQARLYQTLRGSEERYRTLFEQANDAVFLETLEGRILDVNEKACQLLGYQRHELLSLTLTDIVSPNMRHMVPEMMERQVTRGGMHIETENLCKDGSLVSVEVSTALMEVGGQKLVLALVRDISERKRAEQAITERQRYLEGVLASAPDAIVTLDARQRIVEWNHGAEGLFGYSRDEAVGRNIDHLITKPDVQEEAEGLTQVIVGGDYVLPREVVRYRKDGSAVHAIAAGSPIFVEDTLIGIVAVYTDIGERKRAEEALRENEEKYSNLFHHSNDGILLHNLEGTILDANQRAIDQLGYTRSELLALTIADLHPPEALESSRQAFEQISREGFVSFEIHFARKSGQVFPAEVSSSLFEIGGERVVQGVVRDITERKRAERLLRALNEAALAVEQALTLEEIFAAVGQEFEKLGFSCAIFATDGDRTRLLPKYSNYEVGAVTAAEEMIGVTSAELSIPLDSAGLLGEAIREGRGVFAAGEDEMRKVLPTSLGNHAKDLVNLLGVGSSINIPLIVDDEVNGLLSVQSDDLTEDDVPAITAFAHQLAAAWRKAELLQDLEASLRELKHTQAQFLQAQKMEAVGRLAGGVAHDLNNMLTVIQFSTQLIERQLRSKDPLWEHIWSIQEASDRAAQLTKHLLIFSRREVVEPRVVNLSALVRDLSQMLRRIIGEDVELVTPLAEGLWTVKVDPSQIEQAIVNLVVNARDAMPQGGRLTIETANAVLDQAYAARQVDVQPGAYVMLTVSDTGGGMTDEIKAHLFEPFYTTKERGKGTGLGLATVFGIVKRHEGHVSVESEVGRGAVFRIYLPRAGEAREPTQGASPGFPPRAPQGTETILLVEDDLDVRELAAYILEGHGYRVLTAANGPEALRASKRHDGPIDLLLTDVILPKMNGRELAEQLRRLRPGTRVLYMSGYSDDLIADRGVLDEGVVVLSKPFTMDTLLGKVRDQLDLSAS